MERHKGIVVVLFCFLFAWGALFLIDPAQEFYFNPDFTIKQFAQQNGIIPGKLKKELNTPFIRGGTRLQALGINKKRAHRLVSHIRGDFFARKMAVVLMCFFGVVCFDLFLLSHKKMSLTLKFTMLSITIVVFGFALGKSFNPMTGLVKVFKATAGMEGNLTGRLLILVLFAFMAVIGKKAVCGWACPFGALQELIYKLPILNSFKRKNKLPFWLTNTVRFSLFALFLGTLFFNLFDFRAQGHVLYHSMNPFNLFEFNFPLVIAVYLAVTISISFLFYRPHCYFVCPFGLFSWFLEKISIFRVRINREKCTECGACIKACPGLAMKGLYEKTAFPADCFSCGECLDACKFDALEYTCKNETNMLSARDIH